MPNHNNRTLTAKHPRAEKRQDYAHIYICVTVIDGVRVLCASDGLMLAWNNWAAAAREAGKHGMIVVNWQGFRIHYLDRLNPKPPAARIFVTTKRGVRTYRAGLDATAEEIGALNTFCEWEILRRPGVVAKKLRNAKVWPEERV